MLHGARAASGESLVGTRGGAGEVTLGNLGVPYQARGTALGHQHSVHAHEEFVAARVRVVAACAATLKKGNSFCEGTLICAKIRNMDRFY